MFMPLGTSVSSSKISLLSSLCLDAIPPFTCLTTVTFMSWRLLWSARLKCSATLSSLLLGLKSTEMLKIFNLTAYKEGKIAFQFFGKRRRNMTILNLRLEKRFSHQLSEKINKITVACWRFFFSPKTIKTDFYSS